MANTLPFMQFYVSAWIQDTQTLTLAAKGAWMDLLCQLWLSETPGQKTWRPKELKTLLRLADDAALQEYLTDLQQVADIHFLDSEEHETGVYDKTTTHITIKNRRIVRDFQNLSKRKERHKRYNDKRTTQQRRPHDTATTPVQPQNDGQKLEVRSYIKKEKNKKNPCGVPLAGVPAATGSGSSPPGKTTAVWQAYSQAYEIRYHVTPTRNARVNGQLAQFLTRVPIDEAPEIARFYVRHPEKFYLAKQHPVWILLRDAEGLRTQWQTNTQITSGALTLIDKQAQITSAMQIFQTSQNGVTHDGPGHQSQDHASPDGLPPPDGHYAYTETD